jgi:23S rRNA (cytosine1962-C5)-methyltransferase
VDASARALDVASRNFQLNEISPDKHVLVCDDVFAWLRRARAGQDRFDCIILDPPSFSTTRHTRFSAKSDYRGLASSCMGLISPTGGTILACTNHRAIGSMEFRRWLKDASIQAQRDIVRIRPCQPQVDFPAPSGAEPHLKAVWVDIGPS